MRITEGFHFEPTGRRAADLHVAPEASEGVIEGTEGAGALVEPQLEDLEGEGGGGGKRERGGRRVFDRLFGYIWPDRMLLRDC